MNDLLKRRLKWYALILGVVLAFAATWVTVAVFFAGPAFDSADRIDLAQVKDVEVLILNRPDGGPDVGSPREPHKLPAAQWPAAFAPLRNAEPVDSLPPKIWLGKYTVTLADGRRQPIMLYYLAGEKEKRVRFKIGPHQFCGGPVEQVVRGAS